MFIFEQTDNTPREQFLPPHFRGEEEMAELTVLLPSQQAQALEEAAHRDGLTAGQFLRRLISQALRPIAYRQSQ